MRENIIFISDPHFHNYKNHSVITPEGVNSRLLDVKRACDEALRIGREKKCDICCITGDMFQVRGSIKPSVYKIAFEFILNLAMEMHVVIIPGNHDMEDYKGGPTAVDFLDVIPNIEVVKSPSVIDVIGQKILCIPYVHKVDEFKEIYEKLSVAHSDEHSVTLLHQGIDDFAGETGMPDTTITAKYLSEHNKGMVFSGHYHTPATTADQRVTMVGSPLHHTFGDDGNPRGCWTLTKDKGLVFHNINEAPKFLTIDKWKKTYGPLVKGNFIRIKTNTEAKAKNLRKKCEDAEAKSIMVLLEKDYKSFHEKSIKLSTPVKMINEYLDITITDEAERKELVELYNEICEAA